MARPFLSGLRGRLLLLVLMAVLPAFGLTLYSGWDERRHELEQVSADTVTLARILADDQEQVIDRTRQILTELSEVPEVRRGDPDRTRSFFAPLMKLYRGYASFTVLDTDGNVLTSLPVADRPLNFRERGWFQRAMASGQFVIGDYQVGQLTGKQIVVAACPARDEAGNIAAVLAAAIEVGWLNDLAATAQLPPGAVLVLVDRGGTVVARHPVMPGLLGQGLPDEALAATLRQSNEGVVELRDPDGVERIYAYTALQDRVETGLRLAIGVPRETAYWRAARIETRWWLVLVPAMLLTLSAAWFGAERLVLRRVSMLLEAMRKLAAGDPDVRLSEPYAPGELGDLARAFDEMANALQVRQAERDRAEHALGESEERFRAFMDNSPVVASLRDEDGRWIWANATLERTFDLPAGGWRGLTNDDVWSEETAARFARDDQQVLATLQPMHAVGAVTRRDGRTGYWLTAKFPLIEESGRRAVATLGVDLTEWRQIQEELARVERRYHDLVEQALDGIVVTDPTLRLLAVNTAVCEMTGYARDELISHRVEEFLCPVELASTPLRVDGLQHGQGVIAERLVRRKDGHLVRVEISARQVDQGRIQAIVRDITRRQEAEIALRESEERFRLLYQYLPLPYQLLANDGTIVLVNDAWLSLMRMTREQAVGRRFADLLTPGSLDAYRMLVARVLAVGDVHDIELTLVGGDQSTITVLVDVRLGRDERDQPRTHGVLHDVTAAREAERRIRQSEERYRTLFSDSPISLWEEDFSGIKRHIERLRELGVTDLDEHLRAHPEELADCVEAVRVVDVNRATLALYGAETRSQLLAGLDQVIGEDGHDVFRRSIVALAQGERSWKSEGINYTLGGDPIRLALQWSLAPGSEESWSRVLVSAMDVTDRIRAEQALLESEARFEQIFRSAPEILGISRRSDGRYLDVNDAFLSVLGYRREEVLGLTSEQLGFWGSSEVRQKLLRLLGEQGSVHDHEVRVRCRSGEFLDALASVVPLTVGGEDCLLVQIVDVTARRRAEDAQRESQRMLATLMSNLPGMVYQCCDDPEWTMLFVSEGCRELTGYEPDDIVGNRVASYGSLIVEEDREMVRLAVREAIAEQRPYRLTYRIRSRDASLRWVWEQGRVAVSSAGQPITLEGFITDITDRRRAEEELHDSMEQLRQAQKMEAVGRLAGGIAHDFNNLLTAILGYSDLVLNRLTPDDPMTARIEEIRRAGERAASLTRKLLAFSRKQVLAPKVLALDAVLEDLAPMLRRLIGEDIELHVATGDAGNIKADPTQMEQVIMNLVVNARDAMPRGGVLTIETSAAEVSEREAQLRPGAAAGAYATFTISDTGIGMDEATRVRLFEPFFTTKAQGKGTGLGLSTVYGIVQQSGGFVTVESQVGRGTRFRVWLPRVEEPTTDPPSSRSVFEAASGTETILVVEDEESVRRLIRAILERLGYTVLEATHGEEALRIWLDQGGGVDLVITDVVMPHMDGPELISHIQRSDPGARHLYLSGYTDDAIVRRGDLSPGTPFLQKPFTSAALARVVRRVLDGPAQPGGTSHGAVQ